MLFQCPFRCLNLLNARYGFSHIIDVCVCRHIHSTNKTATFTHSDLHYSIDTARALCRWCWRTDWAVFSSLQYMHVCIPIGAFIRYTRICACAFLCLWLGKVPKKNEKHKNGATKPHNQYNHHAVVVFVIAIINLPYARKRIIIRTLLNCGHQIEKNYSHLAQYP